MSNQPYRPNWSSPGWDTAPPPRTRIVRDYRLRDIVVGVLLMLFLGWCALYLAASGVENVIAAFTHSHKVTPEDANRALYEILIGTPFGALCWWGAWTAFRDGCRVSFGRPDVILVRRRW